MLIVAINVLSKLERLYDYDTKKWGVRDEQWNVVIPTIYDEIEPKLGAIFAGKKMEKCCSLMATVLLECRLCINISSAF